VARRNYFCLAEEAIEQFNTKQTEPKYYLEGTRNATCIRTVKHRYYFLGVEKKTFLFKKLVIDGNCQLRI